MQQLDQLGQCLSVGFKGGVKFGTMLILLSTVLVNPSWASGFGAEMESHGQVELLHFGEQQLQVGGRTYHVSPAVRVEIGGTYGAFTLLEPGMKVYLRFVQHSDGRREVLEIRELAAGSRLEES